MNIRISLLSDEIREDNAAKKLRMRHKRATTFRRFTGEPASHMTGIEKKSDTHKNNVIRKNESMART